MKLLTRITVDGVQHWALDIAGHYLELRTLFRHPLTSLALLYAWITASRDDGGSV